MYSEDLDFEIVKILKLELDNRKEAFKLVDFNDMIQKFIDRAHELCPTFDVVFIDEAQDLSPIQWKMYDELKKKSKYVILAGDDDQAIYGWAGADVERFQKEPGKERVLPKSYRVPQNIQAIANRILNRIPNERRIIKTWQPREETGNVYPESYSLQEVPIQEGNWLILARTNYRLISLIPDLKSMGIYFEYKNKKSYSEKLYKIVINWTRYVKGEELNEAEIKDILEYTTYKTIEEIDKNLKWYELLQLDLDDSLYIRKMLERKEPLSGEARVKLSTIPHCKGRRS